MELLITGASGFIGSALVRLLSQDERYRVRATYRSLPQLQLESRISPLLIPGLSADWDWRRDLLGVEVVVHTAARVHVMDETVDDPLEAFRQVNVAGTLNLAQQAAEVGVRRFIFLSSIKVNGEQTPLGRPFSIEDPPNPVDPYAQSKLEAESALLQLAADKGMEVTIIRPVLVYGPGVKGNVQTMIRWVRRGIPLPLGAINNRRSLVALDNLLDLIVTTIHHPQAANRRFLVSDGDDVSTTELLQRLAVALNSPSRLLSVPPAWIQRGAELLGKRAFAQRLLGSLQVDIAATRQQLDWTPPVTMAQGLKQLV
ncbi:MAG: SDR family oxidoreductase [Gammaproteobacteria bacterium]|nr:SDR family oxidoreductase [Gammaproteobacteria bacterium]